MSSRLPETQNPFGLVAWLEETRIALPLKGVECRFDVTGGVASVEIDQIFHQSHAAPLDCTYTFPLPGEAAVFRCEMHINGRVIAARVEERREAKRIFDEQKAAGRRAAMVELERENLFTLSLGNAQPGDVIVIRLAYFQTLERVSESLSLRIPVCPGIRYIPGKPLLRSLSGRGTEDDTDQVPDASRISPPRIDSLHPDAAYFSAEGRIARSDVAGDSLSSPSHPVLIHPDETSVHLAVADHGAVPDRDLVLRWKEPREAALQPRGWVCKKGDERYALVQLRAPVDVAVSANIAHDYYFLVDRSGSMGGAKWTKTCEALTAFVTLLGVSDRVWITLFESRWSDYAEAPMPAPEVLRDKGFHDLVNLGAAGGTELRPAAEHVLNKVREHSKQGAASLIIITDGQVGNERELLSRFRREAGLAVHTFGIDTAVNDAFLKALARQQNGGCWLQTPNDDIAGTVAGLADRLRRPVVTQLQVRGAWLPASPGLPGLHARETLEICLRQPAACDPALEMTGILGSGASHVFAIQLTPSDNPALRLLWTRERIATLLADEKSSEAIALAKAHNILCEGAAFIAWDESEKVAVAQKEIYQPSATPSQPPGKTTQRLYAASMVCGSHSVAEPPFEIKEYRMAPPMQAPPRISKTKTASLSIEEQLIHLGVDKQLASLLSLWVNAKFLRKGQRKKAIQVLLEQLAVPGFTESARAALCREFIDKYLAAEPALHSQALALLKDWEAAAAS